MSSFIGHSLIGSTIFVASKNDRNHRLLTPYSYSNLIWLGWFIVVANTPDLDYIIPFLHPSSNDGLRITHSLLFSLILPLSTFVYLQFNLQHKQKWIKYIIPLIFAGLSHLVLDLLVGVTPLPLLFPFTENTFKLPFGILPSAGKIDLSNYYFYHNLGIELGVIIPLICILLLTKKQPKIDRQKLIILALLFFISVICMYLALNLTR